MKYLYSKKSIIPVLSVCSLTIGLLWYGYFDPFTQQLPLQTIESPCDLKDGPCKTELDLNKLITVSLNHTTLPTLSPLSIDILFEHINPISVSVDFVGLDLNIGKNRPTLNILPNGHYVGRTLLPTYPNPEMKWKVVVTFNTLESIYETHFLFTSLKTQES